MPQQRHTSANKVDTTLDRAHTPLPDVRYGTTKIAAMAMTTPLLGALWPLIMVALCNRADHCIFAL